MTNDPIEKFFENVLKLNHMEWLELAISYLLVKYVPNMKLELTEQMYKEMGEQFGPMVILHGHLSADGKTYTLEMNSKLGVHADEVIN